MNSPRLDFRLILVKWSFRLVHSRHPKSFRVATTMASGLSTTKGGVLRPRGSVQRSDYMGLRVSTQEGTDVTSIAFLRIHLEVLIRG